MTLFNNSTLKESPSVLDSIDFWIKKRYGSKQGFLKKWFYYALFYCGFFRQCTNIDLGQVKRLIFVCQGNICRSPLAEAVAKHAKQNTQSFGLNCSNFHPADARAIHFAQRHLNLDLSEHKTRHINAYQPQSGDLLVGMEPKHLRALKQLFGTQVPITLAGLWLGDVTPYIHDPFNCCAEFFFQCEQAVASSINALVREIAAATTK